MHHVYTLLFFWTVVPYSTATILSYYFRHFFTSLLVQITILILTTLTVIVLVPSSSLSTSSRIPIETLQLLLHPSNPEYFFLFIHTLSRSTWFSSGLPSVRDVIRFSTLLDWTDDESI